MFRIGKDKKEEVDVDNSSKSERTTNDGLPWEKKKSKKDKNYMGDLSNMLNTNPSTEDDATPSTIDLVNADDEESELSLEKVVGIGAAIALLGLPIALQSMGVSVNPSEIALNVQNFFDDPAAALQAVSESVKSMGPLGALYFGAIYTVAEVLAIPAIPLTASAGYLFGVTEGTAIVLLSASIAASIGFLLGRTFLRSYVEKILDDKPEFKRIDRAIGKEGFKVILLLRLSPLFPFSLSNYLYGVTSVKFWPYFFGTMLGFAPGTLAYVYTGEIGKALTLESGTAEPWYIYAGGLVLFSGVLKIVADVATGIIESLDEDDDELYN